MAINNKDVMRCFPLLASALGNKYGVEVRIGGDTARTDGRTIHIPAMPLDMDLDTLDMARGYLDHEAAHIRHTDFQAIREAGMDGATKWLFNAIEDWRVENRLCAIFPGCRYNFNKLIQRMILDQEAGNQNPAFSILNYVLLTVRSWDMPGAVAQAQQQRAVLETEYSGLADVIDGILAETRQNCPDTLAAIDYARRIADALSHAKRNESEMADNDSRAQDDASAPKEEGKSSEEMYIQGGAGQGEQVEEEASSEAAFSEGVLAHAASNSQRDTLIERLNTDLGDSKSDAPKNLGELLSAGLQAERSSNRDAGVVVAVPVHVAVRKLEEEEKHEALRACNALRQRLTGLLQTRTMGSAIMGRRGHLHNYSLHRLCMGNPKVFLRVTPRPGIATPVHILLDCSSSMEGISIKIARQACYALARALEEIKGTTPAVTLFPADFNGNSVCHLLRHGQRVHDNFRMDARGETPLAPALWHVMREMASLKEQRKIILVVTDGIPNSIEAARKAIEYCRLMGLEVYGIGILLDAIQTLLPNSSRVIWSMAELAPAMFGILQNALLTGAGK